MIAYADNTSSMLLNPSRGDDPGLTAMKTQLDSIISQNNDAKQSAELEPQAHQVGNLNSLKNKKPLQNIVITHGRNMSVFEAVRSLRSAIYTTNFHHALQILCDTRLNKVTVLVSLDAKKDFWFITDQC